MKIINRTKNTVLAENITVADTFFKRIRGLLGEKEFPKGCALILKPGNSIHTFFMRFPIDVLFMDKDNRVVKAISHLNPFCLTKIYFRATWVIELPADTIQATSTQKGDTFLIEKS
jgi:uncharacterized membrane protein (UPF0127 family)